MVNRCLETYLRCFTSCQPKKWLHWLPWVGWSYNTSFHTSAKLNPFEIVYGYPPPHIISHELGTSKLDMVEQGLIARDQMLSMPKTNLTMAQNRIKAQADKHKTESVLEKGDLVYLKLVPYQLKSLESHAYHKPHPRCYGLYEVLDKVGGVAYKFKLPKDSNIHHVFHISCLKKNLGPNMNPLPLLPVATKNDLQNQELANGYFAEKGL